VFELIRANKRRSVLLVAGFVLITVAVGAAAGYLAGLGWAGSVFALILAAGFAFFSYWKSDSIALAVSRAHPADPEQYRRLHNLVEGLCIAGGLPKPRVYIIDDPAPNAFATGRNPKHAAIAVTSGLLEKLNRVELEGVIAHELSHIRNYDILVSTLAVTLVGFVAIITDIAIRMMWWNGGRQRREGDHGDSGNPLAIIGFVLLILAPIIARAMQATISRRRETLADVSACQLTRYPPGLISALEKLRDDTTVTHAASTATAHLWIEQPMSGVGDQGRLGSIHRLFDTHPPLEERISLLREL
jgi:heat shock protein HtpX